MALAALALAIGPGFGLGSWLLAALVPGVPIGPWWPAAVQAHGHAQLFGWAALMVLAVGFHFVPRLRGAELAWPHLIRWPLILTGGGVARRVVAQPVLALVLDLAGAPGGPVTATRIMLVGFLVPICLAVSARTFALYLWVAVPSARLLFPGLVALVAGLLWNLGGLVLVDPLIEDTGWAMIGAALGRVGPLGLGWLGADLPGATAPALGALAGLAAIAAIAVFARSIWDAIR